MTQILDHWGRPIHDGLVNVVTSLGTNRDKRAGRHWTIPNFNDFADTEAAYMSSWLAQVIVDVPTADSTRAWRTIKSKYAEEVQKIEKDLVVPQLFEEAECWARVYGGAGILMIGDSDLTKPLYEPGRLREGINKVKKGWLRKLEVFDRRDLIAQDINYTDVLAENYMAPNSYMLRGHGQSIHWTHVLPFYGKKLPKRYRAATMGWGMSKLQAAMDEVSSMIEAKGGIENLMAESNVDVIKAKELWNKLASGKDSEIIKRYRSMMQMKSNINALILDGSDEEFDRKTLSLSGVAQTLDVLLKMVSAASRIPVSKFFGVSSTGLNATGEGEMKNYYDDIRSMQVTQFTAPLRILDEVMCRSAVGSYDDNFDYEWNPLEQPDAVKTAQAQKTKADTDQTYLDAGVITISQVQRRLQTDEVYQFDNDRIDELEELEAKQEQEVPEPGNETETSGSEGEQNGINKLSEGSQPPNPRGKE